MRLGKKLFFLPPKGAKFFFFFFPLTPQIGEGFLLFFFGFFFFKVSLVGEVFFFKNYHLSTGFRGWVEFVLFYFFLFLLLRLVIFF